MNSNQINIEYNFLPNIDKFYNLIKKIHIYSFFEHPEINPEEDVKHNIWPGMRSNLLHNEEKFLEFFMLELAINKFKIDVDKYYKVILYSCSTTKIIKRLLYDQGRDNLFYSVSSNLDSALLLLTIKRP